MGTSKAEDPDDPGVPSEIEASCGDASAEAEIKANCSEAHCGEARPGDAPAAPPGEATCGDTVPGDDPPAPQGDAPPSETAAAPKSRTLEQMMSLKPGDDERTEISKKISWILRHGAKKVNLSPDEEGWVKVEDLFNSDILATIDDRRLLDVITESNSQKTRYEFKDSAEGKQYIRAISKDRRNQAAVRERREQRRREPGSDRGDRGDRGDRRGERGGEGGDDRQHHHNRSGPSGGMALENEMVRPGRRADFHVSDREKGEGKGGKGDGKGDGKGERKGKGASAGPAPAGKGAQKGGGSWFPPANFSSKGEGKGEFDGDPEQDCYGGGAEGKGGKGDRFGRQLRWRVANADAVVRSGWAVETDAIATLLAGTPVVQIGEDKVLKNGIVRMNVESLEPQAGVKGWVTRSAEAAGGPIFFKPDRGGRRGGRPTPGAGRGGPRLPPGNHG